MEIVQIIAAVGLGGVLTAIITWLKDRKKIDAESEKTDVDTKLAYLGTVIERLDDEAKRAQARGDRLQNELIVEQERSALLRRRVRELEDEIDGVRLSARETQHKCDELASRLKDLVADAQEEKKK